MCGISGIYNLTDQKVVMDELIQFTDSMFHRGPDGAGYNLLNNETLGLGQRRLAILDLSESGKQPMSYADEQYWITYNGEIFNFIDIRNELIKLNYQFKSDSDTEVILAAFIQWGKACLNAFNGMFAFAIWDNKTNELFLARDRFGIKPLYYLFEPGKRFAFASETRAFKFLSNFKRSIDEKLLAENLKDPYSIEGLGYTIFNNILQVLPGHFLVVKKDKPIQNIRWWYINDHKIEVPKTYSQQVEKFQELFQDACRIRLISDVPVATALSGGLDSSSVYSTVYSILQNESLGRVNKDSQRAFTAIFPGLENDEREYAAIAAKYTKGPINYLETDIQNLASTVERETELSDFLSTGPISSLSSVYKGMRANGVFVSLDGHGVDEMLYGYRDMVYGLYNHSLWNGSMHTSQSYKSVLQNMYYPEHLKDIQEKFDKQLAEKKKREASIKYQLKNIFGHNNSTHDYLPIDLPALSNDPYNFSNMGIEDRMVHFEFFQHTLPTLLRNFDRAGMMNSVEIRMPFMDWRLVSFVFSLPTESKIGDGFTKKILRDAMKGKMDETLRTRTFKVGISSPVDTWLNGPLKEWALDNLTDIKIKIEAEKSISEKGKINKDIVRKIWLKINTDLIQ